MDHLQHLLRLCSKSNQQCLFSVEFFVGQGLDRFWILPWWDENVGDIQSFSLCFVQTLSNLGSYTLFRDPIGQTLDKCWISMSNLGPNLSLLDRVLTDTVLVLDRAWTDLVHGQSFDRVLTDIGQRLDFLSNVSPKIVRPHEGNQYQFLHCNSSTNVHYRVDLLFPLRVRDPTIAQCTHCCQ